jgi:hypothetical protein
MRSRILPRCRRLHVAAQGGSVDEAEQLLDGVGDRRGCRWVGLEPCAQLGGQFGQVLADTVLGYLVASRSVYAFRGRRYVPPDLGEAMGFVGQPEETQQEASGLACIVKSSVCWPL